jgi:hypothetical protein
LLLLLLLLFSTLCFRFELPVAFASCRLYSPIRGGD